MTLVVRRARQRDVPQLVALMERRRAEYQVLAPLFWKKAARSATWTSRLFRFLLLTRRATFLVATEDAGIVGVLVAVRARVPPVFDPGPTIFVDDFYVSAPERWADAGRLLVDHPRAIAKEKGWAQLIVVSGTKDQAKNGFLGTIGLADTSSWWTGAV